MKTCAVVPAYNEGKTVGSIVRKAKKYVDHVIVVDDGSEDNTQREARKAGAEVISHLVNIGVGFATMTGNDYAIEKGYDIVVNLDSDGQHSASAIEEGIDLLKKKNLDLVIGSRFLKKTERFPWILKFGNNFLSYMNRQMFKSNLTDTQSGFRILTKDAWRRLNLNSSSYSICSEIAAKVEAKKLRYEEISIETIFLDKFKGTTMLDGIRIFSDMIGWWIKKWFFGSKS